MKSDKTPGTAVTAGLRGASWNEARWDEPFTARPYPLVTLDGQAVQGVLYARKPTDRVVFVMHPREYVATHYMVPEVLDAGWSCWVQGSRSIGSDLRLEHEIALLDVDAGMRCLRGLGYRSIVLLGNSGGAGLFAYYNQQSLRDPGAREGKTLGGRPTQLERAVMPQADGVILLSPHRGQGVLLMNAMDASVTDESDPFSVDASLDPFSAANGYKSAPESSRYSAGFIERYRQGQVARVARIDAKARAMVEQRQQARRRLKAEPNVADKRVASHGAIFNVWRTDADLRCWDTSIDPSDRLVGSLWGADPWASNLGSVGFGRVVTPESWLSTWSGLSAKASLDLCASSIEQPALLIEYSGDNCVFPSDADFIFERIASSSKVRHKVAGNHHGQPLEPGAHSGQLLAGAIVRQWLSDCVN